MNKTIYFLVLFTFIVLIIKLPGYSQRHINENFQVDSKGKYISNIYGSVFRIFDRKSRGSLQIDAKGASLVFSQAKSNKDLWTFFGGHIYSLILGLYLGFDSANKKLTVSKEKSPSNVWVYTTKGEFQWTNKSTKKFECVPFNTLEDVAVDKKKCLEYAFYIEVVAKPEYSEKPEQKIIYSELLEFPDKTNKNIKKNPEKHKVFTNIDVYVYGFEPSYKLTNKSSQHIIDLKLEIRRPTVLWVFVLATAKDNLQNICKTVKPAGEKKEKKDKKKASVTKKASTPRCKKQNRNYNIEYHIQYPRLVKNVSTKVASEFGVYDRDSNQIYRCKDILTSPYYIKHFKNKIM